MSTEEKIEVLVPIQNSDETASFVAALNRVHAVIKLTAKNSIISSKDSAITAIDPWLSKAKDQNKSA